MYVKVRVTAQSKKESFEKISSDHFTIRVKEPAARNMANQRVRELIADHFVVPVKIVKIVNGHHSPSKLLSINDDVLT